MNFETPAVLSISTPSGPGTIHACFAKAHAAGEMMAAGGAVGQALDFPADDIQPHTMPGVDNGNDSTLHIGWPVAASLPGNVLALWVNAAVALELKQNHSLVANTPRVVASFVPVLNTSTGGLQPGAAGWTINNNGDYHANSTETTGQEFLPPPAIVFTGSGTHCILPTAHAVFVYVNNSQLSASPVTDTPGSGCASLSATVQSTYANPVTLYPMVWARSTLDPNFQRSDYFDFLHISAVTDGYMVAGGTTPDFAVGDPIELGHWWQNYLSTFEGASTPMAKSGRTGATHGRDCNHLLTGPCWQITNSTPASIYVGTQANGWMPGLNGEGSAPPAPILTLDGVANNTLTLPEGVGRAGTFDIGATITITCDPTQVPCDRPYDPIIVPTVGGTMEFRVDPVAKSLHLLDASTGYAGVTQIIDSLVVPPPHGGLGACTAALRGKLQPAPAVYPDLGDAFYACLRKLDGTYAWQQMTTPQ